MKKSKVFQRNNFSNHLLLLILALLSACGGGGGSDGGGSDDGDDALPIGDISGTWRVRGTESSATSECDGTNINVIATIVQSGNNLTVTGDDGSSLAGTISGTDMSLSGSYLEDGGTTTINSLTATIAGDCNQFTGNDAWSWTDDVFSCSGTSTFTGTRLTGSGCGGGGGSNSMNAVLFGTPSGEGAQRIVVDETRQRILITGHTEGDLNGESNSGGRDIFVAEYDLNLNEKWTTLIGTAANDDGNAIAVNSAGEIFVAGATLGNLGGESNQGLKDAFLAKLDISGNLQWVKLLGSSADEDARGLAIDSNDNIYIAGGSGGSLNGLPYAGGVNDMFLAKYDGDGNRVWLRLVGGQFSDFIRDVTIDNNDNIYACGWYSDNGAQIYLARYDTSGNLGWSKLLGEPGNDFCHKVITDSTGNVYLSGDSVTNLDGNTNQGDRDIVIAKYDSAGNKLWAKLLGSTAEERGRAIGLSSNNTIYVTGSTFGDLNGISNLGMDDIFVSSFDSDGNLQSVNLYGTADSDKANAIDVSSDGTVYITGRSRGDLDGNTNAGGRDIFIKKL